MRIVVTGFEPFGGAEVNASWEAVKMLEGVEKKLLPVSFAKAAAAVRDIVSSRPDAVICVGEAGGRCAISVERVAVNCMDAGIPDNDGEKPADAEVVPGGPAAYFSTLPTRRIAEAVREAGTQAELSYTAGTYVCNSTFYALMDAALKSGRAFPCGFIHVPAKGMPAEETARALALAVKVTAAGMSEG